MRYPPIPQSADPKWKTGELITCTVWTPECEKPNTVLTVLEIFLVNTEGNGKRFMIRALDEYCRVLELIWGHVMHAQSTGWYLRWDDASGFYIEKMSN